MSGAAGGLVGLGGLELLEGEAPGVIGREAKRACVGEVPLELVELPIGGTEGEVELVLHGRPQRAFDGVSRVTL